MAMTLHEYLKLLRKHHVGWPVYVFAGAIMDRAYAFTLTNEPDKIENDPELSNAEVYQGAIHDDPVNDECEIDIVIGKGRKNGTA